MVWTGSGTNRLAPCLVAMFDEADSRWPGRSRASDGSIGDSAHAARTSDHNPDASGDVLAGDLTDDKDAGCDADLFAEHLRRSRDPRVKYVICNGRVFRSYGSQAWEWTPYGGDNGHFAHTHVSVLDTAAAKNDTTPWFTYADAPDPEPPEEDDMPAAPSACLDGAGRRWVFARGTDDKLYAAVDGAGFTAAPGGPLTSGPGAVLRKDGTIEVVARGTDGAVWSWTLNPSTGKWAGPSSLGGSTG